MILVVGATGMLGGEVCRRLAAGGKPFRALVRPTSDPARVEGLRALGAEIVSGDLRDRTSLGRACHDSSAVITTVSSMPSSYEAGSNDIETTDLGGTQHLVDAARAAGVLRFVYTSLSGNIDLDCPLRNAKRTVEAYLKLSGLTYTILRPSCFMQVWLTPAVGFDPANASATIYGTGERPISWIHVSDVAEFAIRSVDAPGARNATLELGGPQPLTQLEAVRVFERAVGQPFTLQHVPEESLRERQQRATDPMERSFATLMRCVAAGDPIDMRAALAAIPVLLTSMEEYAAAVARRAAVPV